jgi:hypothetical protein
MQPKLRIPRHGGARSESDERREQIESIAARRQINWLVWHRRIRPEIAAVVAGFRLSRRAGWPISARPRLRVVAAHELQHPTDEIRAAHLPEIQGGAA